MHEFCSALSGRVARYRIYPTIQLSKISPRHGCLDEASREHLGIAPPADPRRVGGGRRIRTADPLLAKQVLFQLSYTPGLNQRSELESHEVVGLGRFELPTSPLSGVRSSQLSYRPDARVATSPALPSSRPGRWSDVRSKLDRSANLAGHRST